ncbi:hypothetical protein VP01_4331g1 [Puccinia sorghi]|uniref:Uncharacterized protein n=1 Tax=Puccinia sorghi TaxID=27349 RepID=A0A0L6URY4_9BASI|nr:hypothetical protein VP01_4331g1 [Puccinia sorghi]
MKRIFVFSFAKGNYGSFPFPLLFLFPFFSFNCGLLEIYFSFLEQFMMHSQMHTIKEFYFKLKNCFLCIFFMIIFSNMIYFYFFNTFIILFIFSVWYHWNQLFELYLLISFSSTHQIKYLNVYSVHCLLESLFKKGWSNNINFPGLSACQLQAVELFFLFFAVKAVVSCTSYLDGGDKGKSDTLIITILMVFLVWCVFKMLKMLVLFDSSSYPTSFFAQDMLHLKNILCCSCKYIQHPSSTVTFDVINPKFLLLLVLWQFSTKIIKLMMMWTVHARFVHSSNPVRKEAEKYTVKLKYSFYLKKKGTCCIHPMNTMMQNDTIMASFDVRMVKSTRNVEFFFFLKLKKSHRGSSISLNNPPFSNDEIWLGLNTQWSVLTQLPVTCEALFS